MLLTITKLFRFIPFSLKYLPCIQFLEAQFILSLTEMRQIIEEKQKLWKFRFQ